jgi:anti-anti-sigma factor
MDSDFQLACTEGVAKINLSGRLDATNSGMLQEELKKLIGQKIERLIFFAKGLEYISSAGLRVIIFAKQKIGVDAHVYLIGAGEPILNVIKMSGLDTFMTIQDSYTD